MDGLQEKRARKLVEQLESACTTVHDGGLPDTSICQEEPIMNHFAFKRSPVHLEALQH